MLHRKRSTGSFAGPAERACFPGAATARRQASRGFSREQIGQAWIYLIGIVFCTAHKWGHADNEQLEQVFVAHLGDTTEPLFAAARLLKWRQSQPGSELPPRAELMRIGDRCSKCRRADRPDAGDGHETTCNIVAT